MMVRPFLDTSVFLGSMTNVINAPMRRLLISQKASAVIGEMAIAHYVAKGGKQDLALIKKSENNAIFGAQIVGAKEREVVKAAKMAEEGGADFVDFNCACPHHSVLRHGAGAALLKKPDKMAALVAAIVNATSLPVSVKIRSGYKLGEDRSLAIGQRLEDAGASAIFFHGRSKEQLYRGEADWDAIAHLSKAISIPVIGCGDIAAGTQVSARLALCSGVALARGAVVKPWIFREVESGTLIDLSGEERIALLRQLYRYHLDYFGDDERGLRTSERFLRTHLQWMCRYVPPVLAGRVIGLQERFNAWEARDEIETLFKDKAIDALWDLIRTASSKIGN